MASIMDKEAFIMDKKEILSMLKLTNNFDKTICYCSSDSSDNSSESEVDTDDAVTEYEELENLLAASFLSETRGESVFSEKLTNYLERVIPGYSKTLFKEHFHMFPETFKFVLRTIGSELKAINNAKHHGKPISEEKQLLIAIWFMATSDSSRSIATRFGVREATVRRALKRVSYTLYSIASRYIKWPMGKVAANVKKHFAKSGFPNVIGAIGGLNVKVRAASNQDELYTVKVELVCDSFGSFTHVYAGEVETVHDSKDFQNSPVACFIETPELFSDYFPNNSHIVGDAAYTINPHIMVPFCDDGHLTDRQKNFNHCLSSARMVVDQAIGTLKMRFRVLLDCLPLSDRRKPSEFIQACCVLHNICLAQKDEMPLDVPHERNEEVASVRNNRGVELGKEKRLKIMNELQMRI